MLSCSTSVSEAVASGETDEGEGVVCVSVDVLDVRSATDAGETTSVAGTAGGHSVAM
jgi:hypothetical protein